MNAKKALYWVSLSLLGLVVGWLFRETTISVVTAGMLKSVPFPTVACGSPGMLDLIIQGPFVLDNSSNKFVLLGPDVSATHNQPSVIDRNLLNPTGIQPGEYSLTLADTQPGGAQICDPVAGTDLLVIPAKTQGLKSDPNGSHAFAVQLPPPTEIVPWNADPIQISSVTPVPPNGTKVDRLATAVILRYKYTRGSSITFAGTEKVGGKKVSYDLTPLVQGTESFIAIVQSEHQDNNVTHPYAHDAFGKMQALEPPMKLYVEFPSVIGEPGRNTPLIDGVEPKDLTGFLGSYGAADRTELHLKDDKPPKSAGSVHMMINHNDCRAGMILADYTQ
jgi:hypothetical protein